MFAYEGLYLLSFLREESRRLSGRAEDNQKIHIIPDHMVKHTAECFIVYALVLFKRRYQGNTKPLQSKGIHKIRISIIDCRNIGRLLQI